MFNQRIEVHTILEELEAGPDPSKIERPKIPMKRNRKQKSIRVWRRASGGASLRAFKRMHFVAEVILCNHEGNQKISGQSSTISPKGMFVQALSSVFAKTDIVNVIIIPYRGDKTYLAKARICNVANSYQDVEGYGLAFIESETS